MTFITDDIAEKAWHFLRESAHQIGNAKRDYVQAESMRKRIRAIEMARSDAKTVADREREAEASEAYLQAIIDEATAAGAYEELRARRDAASATLDAWRTIRATERAMTK